MKKWRKTKTSQYLLQQIVMWVSMWWLQLLINSSVNYINYRRNCVFLNVVFVIRTFSTRRLEPEAEGPKDRSLQSLQPGQINHTGLNAAAHLLRYVYFIRKRTKHLVHVVIKHTGNAAVSLTDSYRWNL